MAAKKKLKSAGEKTAQALRSAANKRRRIARQHKSKGTKSPAHVRHLLTNRLKRLYFKQKYTPKDFSAAQGARLTELKELLKD